MTVSVEESIFRAMKCAADRLPLIGRSSRELGVRTEGPGIDVRVQDDGTVAARAGGMSVALDSALNLPKHRRPRSLGGEGRDPVFAMAMPNLPESLVVRPDPHPHGLVEPRHRCLLTEFELALQATRPHWSISHE